MNADQQRTDKVSFPDREAWAEWANGRLFSQVMAGWDSLYAILVDDTIFYYYRDSGLNAGSYKIVSGEFRHNSPWIDHDPSDVTIASDKVRAAINPVHRFNSWVRGAAR